MRTVSRIAVLVLLFVIAFGSGASAMDGTRKGFMLGFGLGPSYSDYKVDAVVLQSGGAQLQEIANDRSWGVGIDFRIGGGLNDKVMLFYLSRIPWFDNPVTARGKSVTAGITALAATYSFREEPGGPYLIGGLGLASWSNGFPVGTADTWWGFGVIAGAGWEIEPHFPVELTLQWGKPTGEEFGFDTEARTLTVIATISVLLY